jgi:ADP-ribose pyrophosphatase YjhB (NUDIX family)
MEVNMPNWLMWAREIQALAQTGRTYAENEYQTQRYQRLTEIAAEIVAAHSNLELAELKQNFLRQPGYATPKVDVRGAVLRDGKILLIQEKSDGRWALPGGWADVGESPSEMVVRETWEESGYEVKPQKVVGVYDANRSGTPLEFFHAYKIVFRCELISGVGRPSLETLAVDFFPFNQLPPLSQNRTNERHLKDIQTQLLIPDCPTFFD